MLEAPRERESDFVAWLGRVLYENSEIVYLQNNPQVPFVNIESLKLLYDVFNVKHQHQMDLQSFIDLLQQCGEEQQLMCLEVPEQDDYLPLVICQHFARHYIVSFMALFNQIA